MNTDELKKEAEEGFKNIKYPTYDKDIYIQAYLAGAEPREKQLTELKEFYEIEYFQIADRTADEKIKELEKHQVEVTIDDYSPYDENTWGMMHEEWFVPKEEVRDLLKENYALITKAKELLNMFLRLKYNPIVDEYTLFCKVEQFLNSEVEK
jgi:hypothetical protein